MKKTPALLNKYRRKNEVLTHIPDDAYDAVQDGMQDVVEEGTARIAKIPGINICAKTGTAQNFTILDGKRLELPNNSMFVCFAPKEESKNCYSSNCRKCRLWFYMGWSYCTNFNEKIS
jgi:penicillin-binding protein 2